MNDNITIYSVCKGPFNWFAVGPTRAEAERAYFEAIGIKGFPHPSYRVICQRKPLRERDAQ